MRKQTYSVLDIETTGLRAGRHSMTEIYVAKTNGEGRIKDDLHTLINPGHPIPAFITRLTGITDAMVTDQPDAAEAIRKVDRFLGKNDVIVGHNLRFDMSFLNHARSEELGSPFTQRKLCTLLLARRVHARRPLPSYRLGNLAQMLTIPTTGAHRAKKDVEMTVEVQQHLFRRLEAAGITTADDLLKMQRLPLAGARQLMAEEKTPLVAENQQSYVRNPHMKKFI